MIKVVLLIAATIGAGLALGLAIVTWINRQVTRELGPPGPPPAGCTRDHRGLYWPIPTGQEERDR